MSLRRRLVDRVFHRSPEAHRPDLALIDALWLEQMAPWRGRRFAKAALHTALRGASAARVGVFLFEIRDATCRLHEKPGFDMSPTNDDPHEYVRRARIYRDFLEETVRTFPGSCDECLLAIAVDDEAPDDPALPLFSFQKRRGQRNILLPDFQLIADVIPRDPFAFDDKTTTASFAGSTTGKCPITLQDLEQNTVPRIRAARFFRGSDKVSFELTEIVQCASPDVDAALRAEGFGRGRIGWMDKGFRSKFLISMDGNGAACSRLAVALFSNSVVVAYESPAVLFYSPALMAWHHYVPVGADADVLTILEAETDEPGLHAPIAAAGRSLARRLMSRPATLAYAASLLRRYRRLVTSD